MRGGELDGLLRLHAVLLGGPGALVHVRRLRPIEDVGGGVGCGAGGVLRGGETAGRGVVERGGGGVVGGHEVAPGEGLGSLVARGGHREAGYCLLLERADF